MTERPQNIPCPKCGVLRAVPAYWNNIGPKGRAKKLSQPCKKCGTGRKASHGLGYDPLYAVWYDMLMRCGHKKANLPDKVLRNYRDKGIRVCSEWLNISSFANWANSNGYCKGLMLDRKDNSKGYDPENCHWVTPQVSGQNRLVVKLNVSKATEIRKLFTEGLSRGELADAFNVGESTITSVLRRKTWRNAP